MRTVVEASCVDQDLAVTYDPLIASGGKHENYISFTFCEKWTGFEKTGVFYKDEKVITPYYSVIDETNTCEVPHEVTNAQGTIYFGVFGMYGDVVRTSKVVPYKIKQGALTSSLVPSDPSPDIWEQLLAAYDSVLTKVDESNADQRAFIGEANKAVRDCNEATTLCYEAVAVLNYRASDIDGGDPSTEEMVDDTNDINGGTPY